MAVTDNVASKLLALDEILEEQYMDGFWESYFRHGSSTNKLIPFAEEGEFRVDGDGINVRIERGNTDTIRPAASPLSEFPTPRAFDPDKYKVRFDSTGTANDFMTLNGSSRVSDLDLETGDAAALLDVADRLIMEAGQDWSEKLATLRNVGKTGKLADVNGTPVQNTTSLISTCTATASNTAGMRCAVDGGSIAYFAANHHYDVYNGSTPIATNIQCTDINPGDPTGPSVGFQFNSVGDDLSGGNLASVADNYSFYMSSAYGVGMFGFGAWFTQPATTGDSFIAGRDRQNILSRHMQIQLTRAGSSSVQIALSHLNDAARVNNYVQDKDATVTMSMAPEITDTLRSLLDQNAIIQQPAAGGNKRFAELGAMGVAFQHPQWGRSVLLADPLIPPNTVRVIVSEDWRSLYWGWKGYRILTGDSGKGWYRMNQQTPGTGRGKIWQRDGYGTICDICIRPRRQIGILNVTA